MRITARNQYGVDTYYDLNNYNCALISVTGLNPPEAEISTSPIATKDGSIFTNARVENRNIVLTFAATSPKPEQLREAIYRVFKVKEPIALEIDTNDRTASIDGYVESITADVFARKQRVQISIICPDPYLLSAQETTSITYPNDTVVTTSDTTHGAIFEITAGGTITGGFTIGNTYTGEEFTVNGDYQTGDVITLDTRQGKKSLTLTRGGTTTNNLQNMNTTKHDWLQLVPFEANVITLSSASISAVVKWQTHYEGV